MNVYAALALFCKHDKSKGVVAVDSLKGLPKWILTDSPKDSLSLVRDGLTEITGIKGWHSILFGQVGAFESMSEDGKDVLIVYDVYLEGNQNIFNGYSWLPINELEKLDENSMSIIRYIVSKRF